MARNKTTQLSPKHWKALELIEEGLLSIKEVASSVGWKAMTLYDLMSGNIQRTGSIGELFYSELKKMHARNCSKVKHLSKETQKLSLIKLNERLRDLRAKKPTEATTKEICKIMTSIGKITPNVEISNSYSYTKGLDPEELINEFSRLKSVAEASLVGGGVPSPTKGGTGALPAPIERRSKVQKKP